MEKALEKKKAECQAAGRCVGCQGFRESYEAQLKKKEKMILDNCREFGRFAPIIGMENPYHYRNKVHAVFGEDKHHNVISGTYEENSHRLVPVDSCLLDDERADAVILSVRRLLKSFQIRPYNEDTGYGLLRHVLVRTAKQTGQVMVVLVLASPILPSKNNFIKALLKEHPEITTVVLNVNDRNTSMVLGEKESVLYGKGYIEDTLCGKRFRISVLDAYCGTGTIGLVASGRAAEVIGVEKNGAAVRDARVNAKLNGTRNISFYENDAGRFMTQLARQQVRVDVVFLDPPRAGEALSETDRIYFLQSENAGQGSALSNRPRIPHGEGRGSGYVPVDGACRGSVFVVQTGYKQYIEVKLTMDEMDLTAAEKK